MKIRDHAKGKWPQIITALLGEEFANTRKHRACPATGDGTDRFRFSDRNGCGNFFCGCSEGDKDGFELLMCVKGWTFAEAARAVEGVIGKCEPEPQDKPQRQSVNDKITEALFESSRSKYLASRGLEVAPALRFAKRLDYYDPDGKIIGGYAAMVAPIRRGAEFLSYHVTYLENGRKAPVDPCRKIMPCPSLAGGSVALYAPAKAMGIAEGIETAIAAKMLYEMPVWAALNTSLMKSWQPPPATEEIVIFADKDEHYAGHSAAYALAHRLVKRGLKVQIEFPTRGKDFNDMLLAMRTAA